MPEKFQFSREAAKITFDKVSSWEELNAATLEEADKKFSEKTKESWKEFAVSGVLQFDKKEGRQVLRPFTDLDGRSALGILKEAGIDTSNLTYVRPGEYLKDAINLDTGDKFGVVYEEPTYTAFFDHHAKGTNEVTSTAEIVYKTMTDLGLIKKSEATERLVDFVTKIDNRKFPPEEFLKSAKTILGLQRDLDFDKLLAYFKEHESPTEELTPKEFKKYGLEDSAEKQQKTVDEAMETLERMEKEGKVIDTKYGKIVMNENNELKVGASAAYIKFDGIINFTHGKSFAVTLKEKDFDEEELKSKLGDKFQGKIIRGKMWLYNEQEPLLLKTEDIINVLKNNLDHRIIERFGESEICGIHEKDDGFVKGYIATLQPYKTIQPREYFVGACMKCGEEWQMEAGEKKILSHDERRETISSIVPSIPGVKQYDFSDEETARIKNEELRVSSLMANKREKELEEREFFQNEIKKFFDEILSDMVVSKIEQKTGHIWWEKEVNYGDSKIEISCTGIWQQGKTRKGKDYENNKFSVSVRKSSGFEKAKLIESFEEYQLNRLIGSDKLDKFRALIRKKLEKPAIM